LTIKTSETYGKSEKIITLVKKVYFVEEAVVGWVAVVVVVVGKD